VVIVALLATHKHSVVALAAAWGLGGLAGAVLGFWQFTVRPAFRGGADTLRARLHMSKWLGGNSATQWGAAQATALIVGFILGPVGLGQLRAATTLVSGPTLVLIQAGGSVGLPEASSAFANHGWPGLRRVARIVTAAGVVSIGIVGLVVLLFGSRLLGLIYGPGFSQFWLASDLFAVGMLVSSFGLGAILILKATRHTRELFVVSIVTLVVALAATAGLATAYGVTGAAASGIASYGMGVVFLLWFKRHARLDLARGGTATVDGMIPWHREGRSVASEFG